jgi:hypothetical protein
MASVYARESWDDHGLFRGPGDEFARAMTAMTIETTETLSHSLGQSLITVTGDEAGAETYFIAVARDTAPDGTKMCNQLGGRFVDRLVREDGSWKVKHRIAMRDWSVSIPLTQDWELSRTLTEGGRLGNDPSYDVLGTRFGQLTG